MIKILIEDSLRANENLIKYFSDRSISLEVRLNDFTQLPEVLRTTSSFLNLKVHDELVSDMSLSRGNIMSMLSFIENISYMKEEVLTGYENAEKYSSKGWLKKVNIDELYEEMLKNGNYYFVNQW